MKIYKFRNCLLNTAERSVLRENECLDLTTRTFDVLQFLIEHAGEIVTKDELLGTVWNGNFVEESNLPVHISKLRRSLGETRDARYIETVQGTGYRFVAPVQEVGENEWQLVAENHNSLRIERTASPQILHSIAVLPLENESGDPDNEYLTDGLTESLINSLSQFPNLRVIARNTVFRFKNKNVTVRELGETLGVSRVLTGRVRIVDEKLIVAVELINADDGSQVWGRHYQRGISHLLEVHEEISFAVVESILARTLGIRGGLTNSFTRDPESYRLYLKGRYLLERHSAGDMYKALECFEHSASLDSENIHSIAEILECYRALYAYDYLSYGECLQIISPILESVDKRHQCTDVVQMMFCDVRLLEWKFSEASHYCRTALALNPNCLKGRLRYSDLLMQTRDFPSALEQLEKVMIIDPLSPLIYKRIGRLFYMMGDVNNAIAYLNDALELEQFSHESLTLRGAAYTEAGDYENALEDFQASLDVERHAETLGMMGVVYAKQGRRAKANEVVTQLQTHGITPTKHSIVLAHIYIALGSKEEAYKSLEQAFLQHEPDLRALTYDRRWAPLRREQRFKSLVKRIGLPDLRD